MLIFIGVEGNNCCDSSREIRPRLRVGFVKITVSAVPEPAAMSRAYACVKGVERCFVHNSGGTAVFFVPRSCMGYLYFFVRSFIMQWTGLNELREKYLSFFESKGHLRLPSFPLVPNGDKSILLTSLPELSTR